jgi:hypothetical protein
MYVGGNSWDVGRDVLSSLKEGNDIDSCNYREQNTDTERTLSDFAK